MLDSDARLVEQSRGGDPAAFGRLVERHLRTAYAVALSVLHEPADAEDVAQETMVTAWQKLDQLGEPERFRAWVLQIARRRAYNFRRDESARRVVPLDAAEPVASGAEADEEVMRHELQARLLHAMKGLTEVERTVLLLHDLDGLKHREIATSLELPAGTVRYHLFNARRAVRARLTDEQQENKNAR
jgi:RNA polymerase sigma-70 factor (ECF subfamily)